MKGYLRILIVLIILTLSGGAILASDVSNASFYGIIQAANNSTASASKVSVPFTANTASWISGGIINATATNIAVLADTGIDTAFMPGYGSNPWVVFFDSLNANANRNATIYTGNVTGGKLAFFNDGSGMIVHDNDTNLEPAANFTYSTPAFIDTSHNGTIVSKPPDLLIKTAGGNVTAGMGTPSVGALLDSYTGSADADGDFYGAEWRAQTFTPANDGIIYAIQIYSYRVGNPGTVTAHIRATSAGKPTGSDLANGITNGTSWGESGEWNSIVVGACQVYAGTTYALIIDARDGYAPNIIKWYYDSTSPSYSGGSMVTSADSGATWTTSTGNDYLFRLYEATYPVSVTTPITDGEHIITVTIEED